MEQEDSVRLTTLQHLHDRLVIAMEKLDAEQFSDLTMKMDKMITFVEQGTVFDVSEWLFLVSIIDIKNIVV